jgi:hypothetical protein
MREKEAHQVCGGVIRLSDLAEDKLYRELHPERRPPSAGFAFRDDLASRPRHQGFLMFLGGPVAVVRLLDGLLPDVRP